MPASHALRRYSKTLAALARVHDPDAVYGQETEFLRRVFFQASFHLYQRKDLKKKIGGKNKRRLHLVKAKLHIRELRQHAVEERRLLRAAC